MTGIIAGGSATWARVATDSYLSTAEGDGSNGMKPFVLSHLAAVIAGRGNDELFWIIAMEATKFDIPFDELARFLPDIIIDMTLGVMAALALPPDRRESELFLAGWSGAADRPSIHTYVWRHGQSRIKHRTIVGQDKTIGIITAPHVRNMKATDLTTNDGLLATMRRQSAQAEAASGQKSIGGKVIAATAFRNLVQTEIVGSLDADSGEGESEPPARAGQEACESFAPFRSGATATKRRTPRQKSEPRTSPPGRRE